jgi:signal peptidase II
MRLMFFTALWIFLLDQVIKFYVLFNVFGLR